MASPLDYPHGLPITLQFISANLATGAGTVDMTLPQLGTGFLVPPGTEFYPLALFVTATGTLDAGATVTAQVIGDGTELTNGPSAVVSQSPAVARAIGTANAGAAVVAAGSVVGVSLTKNASYSTTGTIDYDATLVGVLVPIAA